MMSTMLDQLRELERLIMELGAKMGCSFEETRDGPTSIDLEIDSHGVNSAGADSAGPQALGYSEETSSCNFRRYTMELEFGGDDTTESSVPTFFGTPSDETNHDFLVQLWEDEPPFRFELPEMQSFQGEEDANLFDPCNTIGSQHENNSFQQPQNHQRQVEFLQPNLSSTPSSSEWNLQANFERQCGEGLCSLTEDQEFDELQTSEVILDSLVVVSEIVSVETGHVFADMIDWIEIRTSSCRTHSKKFLVNLPAHELFEKMPEKKMVDVDDIMELLNVLGDFYGSIESFHSFVFDPGKGNGFPLRAGWVETLLTLVFDLCEYLVCNSASFCYAFDVLLSFILDGKFTKRVCKHSSLEA